MPWMLQEQHFVWVQKYISYTEEVKQELPARAEEVHHAKEEGIIFDLLTNPDRNPIADENGWVTGMKCVKMELGEPDAIRTDEDRWKYPDSEYRNGC